MAKGNEIVLSAEPNGRFVEGTIAAAITPSPGTVLQIQTSAGIDALGRFTFELYNADADGGRPKGPIYILREDIGQGKTNSEAYAAADHCYLYCPLPGDELNMIVQDVSGTADTYAFGDIMMIDDGTGKILETTGSPETESFMLVEEITAVAADVLAFCLYTGY